MQSKAHSFIESIVNVVIGFVINVTGQVVIFPLFDIHVSFASNLGISICFTGISIARSYLIRRYFTKRTEATA